MRADDEISEPAIPVAVAVVLSYNAVASLLQTLEAIRGQTFPVRQLIVVDNGSMDGSQERLASTAVASVLLPRNVGVGAGHNAGWRAALAMEPTAQFLWVLEHDSVPTPDCLQRLVETFEDMERSGHNVAAVVPRQVHPDRTTLDSPLDGEDHPPRLAVPRAAPRMTFNAALIQVRAIRDVGLLREDFFIGQEDREYAWRLTRAGYAVIHVPSAVVVHRNKGARRNPTQRSVLRDYYSARNELYVRRFVRHERWAFSRVGIRSALHVGRVLLRGDEKLPRVRARLMALLDGIRGDLGQKHYSFLTHG